MADLKMFENLVTGIVVIGVILFAGLRIMAELRTQASNTAAINTAMDEFITAIATIPGWVSVVIVVAVGAFLILFLKGSFGKGKGSV